jgi:hypothetical protein
MVHQTRKEIMFSNYRWIHEMNQPLEAVKKLRVFDMDDTLLTTSSRVKLTTPEGTKFLTPKEYNEYTPKEGESYGPDAYEEFGVLIQPKEIEYTVPIFSKILKALHKDSENRKVMILTSRSGKESFVNSLKSWLSKYAQNLGISQQTVDQIEIRGIGSSNPEDKADVIRQQIEDEGFMDVKFFDDAEGNVKAVKEVERELKALDAMKYDNLHIEARHIIHFHSPEGKYEKTISKIIKENKKWIKIRK